MVRVKAEWRKVVRSEYLEAVMPWLGQKTVLDLEIYQCLRKR